MAASTGLLAKTPLIRLTCQSYRSKTLQLCGHILHVACQDGNTMLQRRTINFPLQLPQVAQLSSCHCGFSSNNSGS